MAQPTTKNNTPYRAGTPRQAPTGNLPARQQQRGNAPAQQAPQGPPPIVQFREYVNQRMATLEEALPPHIRPDYFVTSIMVALQKKPALLKCTFPSIWNACVEAAKDGLLPDNKEGAIVPYGENADGKRVAEIATWMPMIEGYRKKIFETGKVRSWEVQVVREKDEFEYELGDNAFIKHKPFIGITTPGNIVGAYSIAKLSSGETVREVMGAYDIMRVASKSKAGNGPWKDPDFVPEMARKVVARRHYKQLPHTRELSDMIARDDARFGIDVDDDRRPAVIEGQAQPAPRLSAGQAFDTYAGTTFDQDTGEIDDGPQGGCVTDQDRADFEQEASSTASSPPATGANKGADVTSQARAPAPTNSNAAEAGSPRAASAAEAGAQGTSAPASTARSSAEQLANADRGVGDSGKVVKDRDGAGLAEQQQDDQEGIEEDGADRPWPPGAAPTNEAEYGRYLRTKLEAFTVGADVPKWWNSADEKQLRGNCGVGERFKEYQDLAIARRTDLGSGQK
ncbi:MULTISPECIES: recombinase RecT [unclassified Bradyrhizobium]|uniref:recombinase RecT n=1 Tax=unclassified Bradyrhizobium TaxID=2631580 RepID=UPI002915F2C4|nr:MULTISPECIES: recombinase RecT [unclassified Bradyrhizobium]